MITREAYVEALRAVADWVEANPDIPGHKIVITDYSMNSKEQAAAVARACRTFTKDYSSSMFELSKEFGPVTLRWIFNRDDVCERKVIGKKSVPDVYSPGYLIPAHEEEIVEWECNSLLADPVPQAGEEPVGTLESVNSPNYDDKEIL